MKHRKHVSYNSEKVWCKCNKRRFKLAEIKVQVKKAAKTYGQPMYFYRCPMKHVYHLTHKEPWEVTRQRIALNVEKNIPSSDAVLPIISPKEISTSV